MDPKVSIITPFFYDIETVEDTIHSVINQTFGDWELLIVDDRSSIDQIEKLNQLICEDKRIRLIRLEKNSGGPAKPRNEGIKKSRGKYIAFIDSDDIWHPLKLELQIGFMEQNKINFTSTGSKNFLKPEEILIDRQNHLSLENISLQMQKIKGRITNSSVIVEKSILVVNKFNELKEYVAVEDYDCWVRILQSGEKHIKVKNKLLFYRISANQISGSKTMMARKVFNVHINNSNSVIKSLIYTLTHIVGAIFYRFINKGF